MPVSDNQRDFVHGCDRCYEMAGSVFSGASAAFDHIHEVSALPRKVNGSRRSVEHGYAVRVKGTGVPTWWYFPGAKVASAFALSVRRAFGVNGLDYADAACERIDDGDTVTWILHVVTLSFAPQCRDADNAADFIKSEQDIKAWWKAENGRPRWDAGLPPAPAL